MTNPKPEEIIRLEGRKGDSLFYGPVAYAVNEKNVKDIEKKLDSYVEIYAKTIDDRALAIIGALSVENELDNFLAKWIKGYKQIKDWPFSSKIELAISLRIVPTKILNAIKPITIIRNIFAHNLDIDTFEKAREFDSKSGKPCFPNLYDKIKTFIVWDKKDDRETLKELILMVMLGLDVYAKHIARVQDYVWNPKNLERIIKD